MHVVEQRRSTTGCSNQGIKCPVEVGNLMWENNYNWHAVDMKESVAAPAIQHRKKGASELILFRTEWFYLPLSIGVWGRGATAPPAWKFSGQTLFSGQVQAAKKSWMIKKKYSTQWIQGTLCFSGQAQVAPKSWMVKNIFNTVKHFRANSVFQGKRKLLKNPERWKNLHYSIFSVGLYSLGCDPCNLG